ncbi:MAG TPA: hypothetical protein VGX03_33510 [Candidatus Binatia bacterium]|jgi:hypothetical protein|nr:hypothetical protein [Candidatus Binatia bacterium]
MLAELDTIFLALAVALNGYLAWSAARMVARVDEKTDAILETTRTSLEALIELLKRTKTA